MFHSKKQPPIVIQCTQDIVATIVVAIKIYRPLYLVQIHLFYYIQVGYNGQLGKAARKGCPR